MPLNSTRGASSAKGFGFTSGVKNPPVSFDYLVVAGGGGGGANPGGGGGGAGGYRTSFPGGTKITLDSGIYPITIGAGGPNDQTTSPGTPPGVSGLAPLRDGGVSIFSTITSAVGAGSGGAGGITGYNDPERLYMNGGSGGSGGGAGAYGQDTPISGPNPGGSGNTPPTSPSQGNPGGPGGGNNPIGFTGGGGGGATGAGASAFGNTLGYGGDGAPNLISGTDISYAGGGGGGRFGGPSQPPVSGGVGGGGSGANNQSPFLGSAGTTNTGGGGGGGGFGPNPTTWNGYQGGSGIIIIRAPSIAKFTVSPGTNTISTAPNGDKVATFTVSGNLTI
jgi:hypothetical protein